jgi:formyltetrahydrofolate deformylase
MPEIILTLSATDQPGIVASVATFLAESHYTIRDSQQFGDEDSGLFFMRVTASPVAEDARNIDALRAGFDVIGKRLGLDWRIHDAAERHRLLVMVSKQGHCLNDLLHRVRTGALKADIVAVVSNHEDLRSLVEWHGIPFHHVPVTADTKAAAEEQALQYVVDYEADTVVLARYMQILSDDLCQKLHGRAINIHHSLLPSFKGARPYFQAHARGVKVVGATAHYVTAELDEGPIIEQDFSRVDHTHSALDLTEIGKDLESLALARAVAAHAERRVLLNGHRTVVFRP